MVTPRVVAEVQKHFNCAQLEGAELEDQGGEGTALTHWEKRVFEAEAMSGTHSSRPVFSRITLALMEGELRTNSVADRDFFIICFFEFNYLSIDTGWYKANYEMAGELTWGRNLGCEFVMKSCKSWIDSHSSE